MQRDNDVSNALKKTVANVSGLASQQQQNSSAGFKQSVLQHYVLTPHEAEPDRQAIEMFSPVSIQRSPQPQTPLQAAAAATVVVTQPSTLASHSTLSIQDANAIQQVLSIASSAARLQTQAQPNMSGTIHHHGQQCQLSVSGSGLSPLSVNVANHQQPQPVFGMSLPTHRFTQRLPCGTSSGANVAVTTTDASVTSITCSSLDSSQVLTSSAGNFSLSTSASTSTTVAPPRKRIKLEEKPPSTPEIAAYRKKIIDFKLKEMAELKENYSEHWTECYFLNGSGNIMDFLHWKKRPPLQLVQFLKAKSLDSDDEDETLELDSSPMKNTGNVGSVLSAQNLATSTPTTLTPTLAALTQQGIAVFQLAPSPLTLNPGSLEWLQEFQRQISSQQLQQQQQHHHHHQQGITTFPTEDIQCG